MAPLHVQLVRLFLSDCRWVGPGRRALARRVRDGDLGRREREVVGLQWFEKVIEMVEAE